MTGDELIERFESGQISGDSFHHADHVYLAFAYLTNHPVLLALEKFSTALRSFAASHEKPHFYHETITCAYFFLIHERMARCAGKSWDEFAARNPDLLEWNNGMLSRYYQTGTLQSELAKRIFILPDRSLVNFSS